MLGPVLLRFGTEVQKRYFLPKLANLDLWFCQGFSEPESGSDLASLRTRAQRQGDHYIVNGQKIWTTMAHEADWIFALVRTEQTMRKQDGISFLMIDMRTPGITVKPIVSIDGEHHLNEVFFDNVEVPVANLVGEEGRGWECAKFLLNSERTGVANVGYCWERLEYIREIACVVGRNRKRPIDDPKLAAELAMLGSEVRALELTNWRFQIDPDIARKVPGFASILKLKGSELTQEITSMLTRIAGLKGIERRVANGEHALHPLSAAAARYFFFRAATIYGGCSEVQKDILAKSILG